MGNFEVASLRCVKTHASKRMHDTDCDTSPFVRVRSNMQEREESIIKVLHNFDRKQISQSFISNSDNANEKQMQHLLNNNVKAFLYTVVR